MPRIMRIAVIVLTTFLVCAGTLAPALAYESIAGFYIKDGRSTDEYLGFVATLLITDLGGGRYSFQLTTANPALCGAAYEGEFQAQGNAAHFSESDLILDFAFSDDLVTIAGDSTPSQINQCPLPGEYYRQGAFAPASEEEVVARIREHYAAINQEIGSFAAATTEVMDMSAEGGELTAWFNIVDYLKKISVVLYGEMGRVTMDYYYWENEPMFCFVAEMAYDKPFGEVVEVFENRYYFDQVRMVAWATSDNGMAYAQTGDPMGLSRMVRWIKPDGTQVAEDSQEFQRRARSVLETGRDLRDRALHTYGEQ